MIWRGMPVSSAALPSANSSHVAASLPYDARNVRASSPHAADDDEEEREGHAVDACDTGVSSIINIGGGGSCTADVGP